MIVEKDEIDKMVADADRYKADDEKQRERIGAKNALESYCFNMKSTIEDENMKGKISEEDKKTIAGKCDETIKWLDANQTAEKDEFEHKQKEVESTCNPIVTKLYQGNGAMPNGTVPPSGGMNGNSAGQNGPTVEEVD